MEWLNYESACVWRNYLYKMLELFPKAVKQTIHYHQLDNEPIKLCSAIYSSPIGPLHLLGDDENIFYCNILEYESELEKSLLIAKDIFPQTYFDAQPKAFIAKALHAWFHDESFTVQLQLKGNVFQHKIWNSLTEIALGTTSTYGSIAQQLQLSPGTARAVGTAIGQNPIALFIPCHRVRPKRSGLGGYRWGLEKKKWLLNRELQG